MKEYDLNLPVYKKGDDMHGCIEHTQTVSEAFKTLADQYTEAAKICMRMAGVAAEHDLEVWADTHMIGVSGPENVLDNLVKKGILYVDEYEDDEDEYYDEEEHSDESE